MCSAMASGGGTYFVILGNWFSFNWIKRDKFDLQGLEQQNNLSLQYYLGQPLQCGGTHFVIRWDIFCVVEYCIFFQPRKWLVYLLQSPLQWVERQWVHWALDQVVRYSFPYKVVKYWFIEDCIDPPSLLIAKAVRFPPALWLSAAFVCNYIHTSAVFRSLQ